MRILDSIFFFCFGMVVGVVLYVYWWKGSTPSDPMPEATQQVIMQRIERVAKLITIEGDISIVQPYKDEGRFAMTSKKALITTQGRVSVGYDLKKATFEADANRKIIRVKNLPQPEILSIANNIQYYDIDEGMFNQFSEDDFTDINQVMKKKIRESALKSDLIDKARQEGIATLDLMRVLVEQGGWTLEIVQDTLPKVDSTLKIIPDPKTKPVITN